MMRRLLFCLLLISRSALALADSPMPPASSAFCLFEAPPEGDRRIFVNLAIVQYLELRADELRVYYGGGNFGSGHEMRFRIASRDEGLAWLQRMQAAAARCAGKGG